MHASLRAPRRSRSRHLRLARIALHAVGGLGISRGLGGALVPVRHDGTIVVLLGFGWPSGGVVMQLGGEVAHFGVGEGCRPRNAARSPALMVDRGSGLGIGPWCREGLTTHRGQGCAPPGSKRADGE